MPGALTASPATTSGHRTGMAYGHLRLGTPVEIRDPDLERVCLFRTRDGRPRGGTGRDVGPPDRGARAAIPTAEAYWHERACPSSARSYAWVAARPVETMPAAASPTLGRGLERIGRCWSIHFYAIRGPYQVLEDLADLYESVIEAPTPGEALGLIGGSDHELQAVECGTRGAGGARRPDARARRAPAEPGVTIEDLAACPDAAQFARAVEAFLASTATSARPTTTCACLLGEEPGLLWPSSPSGWIPRSRSAPRAASAARGRGGRAGRCARAALAGDPAPRAVRGAPRRRPRDRPLTEAHNYWIDRMAQASCAASSSASATGSPTPGRSRRQDVFHLHRDEVPDLLRRP